MLVSLLLSPALAADSAARSVYHPPTALGCEGHVAPSGLWRDAQSGRVVAQSRRGRVFVVRPGLPSVLVGVDGETDGLRLDVRWGPSVCAARLSSRPVRIVAVGQVPGAEVEIVPRGCAVAGPWTATADARGRAVVESGWLAEEGRACTVSTGDLVARVGVGQANVVLDGPDAAPWEAPRGPFGQLHLHGPPAAGVPVAIAAPEGAVGVAMAGCGGVWLWDDRFEGWPRGVGPLRDAIWAMFPFLVDEGVLTASRSGWSVPAGCPVRAVALLGDGRVHVGAPVVAAGAPLTFAGPPMGMDEALLRVGVLPEDEPLNEWLRVHAVFDRTFRPLP